MHVREDIVKAIGEAVALRAAERRAVAEAPADLPVIAPEAAVQSGEAEHYRDTQDANAGSEGVENSWASTRAATELETQTIAASNDAWPNSFGAEPTQSAGVNPRGSIVSSLVWGVMGFLIGAVFWHFIGFWGFISEIVFVGGSVREDRLVEQTGSQCVQLVLDRSAGTISSENCPFDAPLLNEGALAVRADFAGDRGPKITSARPAIRLSDGTR